jgi:ABC-type multidrug transport system fused ATPase/permease subunit
MAALDVYRGALTPGDFVMIQSLFMQLAGPMFSMGTLFRQMEETSVDVEELFHMLKTKPSVVEKPDAKEFEFKEGGIKIEDLNFCHYIFDEPGKPVLAGETKREMSVVTKPLLNNFSLEIEPGTTNAIVGPSGFGKTTFFNLLFRIYEPESGRILLDGQDLSDLKFDSFRKYISIIPQNGILFNETIMFNL